MYVKLTLNSGENSLSEISVLATNEYICRSINKSSISCIVLLYAILYIITEKITLIIYANDLKLIIIYLKPERFGNTTIDDVESLF